MMGGCVIGAALALAPSVPDLMAGRGKVPWVPMLIGCGLGMGLPPLVRGLRGLPRLPRLLRGPLAPRNPPGTYRPPWRLPKGPSGAMEPSSPYPHSQIGTGRGGNYTAAREWGSNGRPVKDIHFTDHGRPGVHTNPHQHPWISNPTGGTPIRGAAEPFVWP
jgi:hypothetical protein